MGKIEYNSVLDVTKLFTQEQISSTFTYIVKEFLEEIYNREAEGEMFAYPIVGFSLSKKINIDYAFLIKKLSELVDNEALFKSDFRISNNEDDILKNNLFLVHNLLENLLELVKMNSTKIVCKFKGIIHYKPSYYVPLIIKRDNYYAQMSAVSFAHDAFDEYVPSELLAEFKDLVLDGMCNQVPGTYGSKQCYKFWETCEQKKIYIAYI